jgi:hypothetical protein
MSTDRDDDVLLERLSQVAAQADPLPDDIAVAAREAIRMHDVDGELAELIADSASTAPDLEYETVRATASTTADRLLSFEGGGVRVELEVLPGDEALTVIGQLVGASPDSCDIEYGDGRRETVQLDELGRFLLDRWRGGPVRIRCRSEGGQSIITSWVSL